MSRRPLACANAVLLMRVVPPGIRPAIFNHAPRFDNQAPRAGKGAS